MEFNKTTVDGIPAINIRLRNSPIRYELIVGPTGFAIALEKVPLPKNAGSTEIDWGHIKNLDINIKLDDNMEFGGGHFCPDDYPTEKDGGKGVKYKFTYCKDPAMPVDDEPYRVTVKVKKCTPNPDKDKPPIEEDVPCEKLGKRKTWTNWPENWTKDREITSIISQCWNAVKCDAKPTKGSEGKYGVTPCVNNKQCYEIRWRLVSYKEKGVTKWKLVIVSMYPVIKEPEPEPEPEPDKDVKPIDKEEIKR